jgi:hypothetical protein
MTASSLWAVAYQTTRGQKSRSIRSASMYTLDGKDCTEELSAADAVVELTAVVGWAELV